MRAELMPSSFALNSQFLSIKRNFKTERIGDDYLMDGKHFLPCPVCNNKTRTKTNSDTTLINFPLFCPKCKKETLVDLKNQKLFIKEPAAKMQSR